MLPRWVRSLSGVQLGTLLARLAESAAASCPPAIDYAAGYQPADTPRPTRTPDPVDTFGRPIPLGFARSTGGTITGYEGAEYNPAHAALVSRADDALLAGKLLRVLRRVAVVLPAGAIGCWVHVRVWDRTERQTARRMAIPRQTVNRYVHRVDAAVCAHVARGGVT